MARLPKLPLNIAQLQRGVRLAGRPEPGFFKLRLVKGGPFVPAIIWRPCPMILPVPFDETPAVEDWCRPTERGRPLCARIGDEAADPFELWERGWRITAAEYHHLMAIRQRARRYALDEPEARPRRRVDLARQASLF